MKKFESELVNYIPRLRRYSRALCHHSHMADDLVQDTLERALAKKSLWLKGSKLRPWLFTIMHNLYINQVRRYGSLPEILELDEAISDTSSTPDSLLYAQQLQRSIELLPVEQKETFLLISLEGFSYEEVANIMEIPVGTVMSRLSRARDKLRNLTSTHSETPLRRIK